MLFKHVSPLIVLQGTRDPTSSHNHGSRGMFLGPSAGFGSRGTIIVRLFLPKRASWEPWVSITLTRRLEATKQRSNGRSRARGRPSFSPEKKSATAQPLDGRPKVGPRARLSCFRLWYS